MTAETGPPSVVEDARGLLCPIPVIRLAARLPAVPVGSLVLLLADDAAAHADVVAWCKGHRHEVVSVAADGPVLKILVRRLR